MYKVEILSEDLQAAAIQRRQKLDEERKQRIFNPKVRILGIDMEGINEQIRIKNEIKKEEKLRTEAFDRNAELTNEILQQMDTQMDLSRRQQRIEMNEFRRANQQPHQRRDFDLYDPQALQKDLPARTSDEDFRIGVSSLQRFEGEDLSAKNRAALQKEQMRVWVNEQVYEKERRRQEELEERRKYEEFQRNINDKMAALQNAVEQARKERALFDKEYNNALAEEKRRRMMQQKQYETEQNNREIQNHVHGVFLTETPDVFNIKDGHKVRVDLFKGMTPDQKQEILRIQSHQRIENERTRELKLIEEEKWALQESANNRALALMDRDRMRKMRENAVEMRKENEKKAQEDKKRKEFIDKVLYTNPPQESYFEQFNTTSR